MCWDQRRPAPLCGLLGSLMADAPATGGRCAHRSLHAHTPTVRRTSPLSAARRRRSAWAV